MPVSSTLAGRESRDRAVTHPQGLSLQDRILDRERIIDSGPLHGLSDSYDGLLALKLV